MVASGGGNPLPGNALKCLNPLHCGAVVASFGAKGLKPKPLNVSIPFIAGQWSLRCDNAPRARARRRDVSIPFIAGQWSLRPRAGEGRAAIGRLNPLHCGAVVASCAWRWHGRPGSRSQSPSLRGSGRFTGGEGPPCRMAGGLNPLHCGAVVASWQTPRRRAGRKGGNKSQSPSLRGSGRFRKQNDHRWPECPCLNPLHCGAVVASLRRP